MADLNDTAMPGDTNGACSDDPAENVPGVMQLAEQFFDLWQDQIAAWASDPEIAQAFARLCGQVPQAPSRPSPFAPPTAKADCDPPNFSASSPPGSKTVAAASWHAGSELFDFATRLGALEERLVTLERRHRSARRRPAPRSRRGRP